MSQGVAARDSGLWSVVTLQCSHAVLSYNSHVVSILLFFVNMVIFHFPLSPALSYICFGLLVLSMYNDIWVLECNDKGNGCLG